MTTPPSIPPIQSSTGVPPVIGIPPAPRQRLWPTLLLVALVFVSGLGLGVAGTVIIAVRRAKFAVNHPAQALATNLKRRLNLSAAQAADLEVILTKRQQRLATLRQKLQPEVDQELEATRDEINQILRPGQRAKLDTIYEEIKSRVLPPN